MRTRDHSRIGTRAVLVVSLLAFLAVSFPPGLRAQGDPDILEKLCVEYVRPLPDGMIHEADVQAEELYGIDYRSTVAKAAAGDRESLDDLFALALDGAAAEIHAEVLTRLEDGYGAEAFGEALGAQARVLRRKVRELIEVHRENTAGIVKMDERPAPGETGDSPGAPSSRPTVSYLAGGDFEGDIALDPDGGKIVSDPTSPGNHLLSFSADDYLVRPLSIPPEVNDVRVSLRVLVPPTVRLEQFEPGQPAPGVKIRIRHSNELGNSGISDWVVGVGEGWRTLTTTLGDIGSLRDEFSVEASWFEGTIFLDDIVVEDAFPIFLTDELYETHRTPAQVVYGHVGTILFDDPDRVTRGEVDFGEEKVALDFSVEGAEQTLWFVEKRRTDEEAEVVVGPPNAGGDLFELRKIDGRWAIVGIISSDGI